MVVSYEIFVAALEKKGYTKEVSIDTANRVMGLYGRANDRRITKDMRSVLYMLQEQNIVLGEMQEAEIPAGDCKGRPFRLYSWALNEDYIHELTKPERKKSKSNIEDDFDVYNDEKMWDNAEDAKLETVLT